MNLSKLRLNRREVLKAAALGAAASSLAACAAEESAAPEVQAEVAKPDADGVLPWSDFLRIRRELDPQGRFMNEHLQTLFGAA